MSSSVSSSSARVLLLIGASRGLGLGLAEVFAKRGWSVVATARQAFGTRLHDLARKYPEQIQVETLDMTDTAQISTLRDRLNGRLFDILFVNAGTADQKDRGIAAVPTEEFARVLVTNALSPMRVIETLAPLVRPGGLVGVMSSGQGSIADNVNGRHEVYRCSKTALNQLMKSYAARHVDEGRALLLMAPGWIRTDLGGPEARYSVEDSMPKIADVLLAKRGRPGLEYLDRDGLPVSW
ncbi:SDR family oxidoreductase [Brevundimonas sp. UBA7534]|uniref:SDR family oxidoreductase n=1 Tax=Brevundimonas sp. UBA7534 TaxID=1946138 RepID=UPI0025BA949B|nr:SDR family oxidoreductase [Brevundimonas sp. UBA7534]